SPRPVDSLVDALRRCAKAKKNLHHKYTSTKEVESNKWVIEPQDDVALPGLPASSQQWEKDGGGDYYSRCK
ncbi:MAG: hypothetical protein Q9199_006790, partial [Rusavskia elegans]